MEQSRTSLADIWGLIVLAATAVGSAVQAAVGSYYHARIDAYRSAAIYELIPPERFPRKSISNGFVRSICEVRNRSFYGARIPPFRVLFYPNPLVSAYYSGDTLPTVRFETVSPQWQSGEVAQETPPSKPGEPPKILRVVDTSGLGRLDSVQIVVGTRPGVRVHCVVEPLDRRSKIYSSDEMQAPFLWDAFSRLDSGGKSIPSWVVSTAWVISAALLALPIAVVLQRWRTKDARSIAQSRGDVLQRIVVEVQIPKDSETRVITDSRPEKVTGA